MQVLYTGNGLRLCQFTSGKSDHDEHIGGLLHLGMKIHITQTCVLCVDLTQQPCNVYITFICLTLFKLSKGMCSVSVHQKK